MKQATCEQCHQLVPVNETLSLLGRQLCRPCATEEASRHPEGKITADSITRHVDPTVCAQCGSDNGESELPTLANVPLCGSCESYFRNRPYPAWLKLSFVALVALAVFSFGWNWRFLAAYREMRQVERALTKGDIDKAAQLSDAAARHVPEATELGCGGQHVSRPGAFEGRQKRGSTQMFQDGGSPSGDTRPHAQPIHSPGGGRHCL